MYPTPHWSQQDGGTSTGSHPTGPTDPNTAAVVQATPAQDATVPVPSTPHGAAVPNAAYTQQYLDAQRAHYEGSQGTTSRAGPFRHSVSRFSHPTQVGLDRPLESMSHGYTAPGSHRFPSYPSNAFPEYPTSLRDTSHWHGVGGFEHPSIASQTYASTSRVQELYPSQRGAWLGNPAGLQESQGSTIPTSHPGWSNVKQEPDQWPVPPQRYNVGPSLHMAPGVPGQGQPTGPTAPAFSAPPVQQELSGKSSNSPRTLHVGLAPSLHSSPRSVSRARQSASPPDGGIELQPQTAGGRFSSFQISHDPSQGPSPTVFTPVPSTSTISASTGDSAVETTPPGIAKVPGQRVDVDYALLDASFRKDDQAVRRTILDIILASRWYEQHELEPKIGETWDGITAGLGVVSRSIYTVFLQQAEKNHWMCTFGDEFRPCPKVGYQFERLERGVEHVRSHLGHRPYPCSHRCGSTTCEKRFFASSYLEDHLKRPRKRSNCPVCGESVQSQNLSRHMSTHNRG